MPIPHSGSLARRMLRPLLLLAIILLPLWHVHDIDRDFHLPYTGNDLIGRWYGTRAALHRQDPYSPELTRQIQAIADHDRSTAFDYPATFAVLLAPMAALPWKAFSLVYLLLIVPSLAVSFWLCVRSLHLPLSRRVTGRIVLAALFSWPAIWGLRLLQPALLEAVFLFLGCFFLVRGRGATAGFLLALATIKPQTVLPLLLWLLLWTGLRRQWRFLLSFAVTTTALLALAEWLIPGWFTHWLHLLRFYQSVCPKLPLEPLLGYALSRIVVLELAVWAGWRLWRLRHCPPSSTDFGYSIALLLAFTIAANPTQPLMVYNDIFLL
ncbi:MAG: glycosyltransferase family 87 protein, partial [Acidobacteriota bacterium]